MRKIYLLTCVLFISFVYIQVNAQQKYEVKKGERPPIDLQNVPENAYEKGIIKIKLNESLSQQLDMNPVFVNADGQVRFNIEKIDELNNRFEATKFKKLFESNAFTGEFEERHRAWGFHLWYTLYFDEKSDVKEIVNAYSQLSEVIVAELEYKKELYSSEPALIEGKEKGDDPGPSPMDWTPNDPSYGSQWHYHNTGQQSGTPDADIDLPEAWDIERGNSNVIVCIEDGGVQYDHPDLSGNMWSGIGYNFVTGSSTIEPHYHGTHVAGTVAAETNNGIGVSGVAGGSGSNDGVRLMSCQVFTSSSSGGFHLAPVYAADNGACISQNSWGYTSAGYYEQSVLDAIDYFNLNGGGSALNGGITIYAAGNSNSNGNYYPGYYSGTLAVAATNNQDIRSYYSNYGTWVDVSAPGGETNAVTARGVYSTYTGSSYAYLQGTSMACPHTSGVAALIISLAYGSLTAADVADILINTTDNIDAINPSYAGQLGSGRINAYQALLETQNYLSGVLNPQTFTATAVSTSQINLAWTKNASNNNVMVVWSPTGTFGIPNNGTVYNAGQSIPGGGTVLYRGSNTSYNHTSLNPSTTYYYKAFSYDGSNDYSSGKNAQATTFCDAISTLPFSENFNAGVLPICWDIVDNQGNGQVWQIGTITGYSPNPALTAPYAFLNSDAYGSGNTQNSDLVSPLFDFSGYTSINISFSHYFRWYSPSTATLSYSLNGGTSWTTIQTWTSTSSNPATFNQPVAAVAGQSNVKFKWNYSGTWGYYWAVDDISITGTLVGSPPVADFTADDVTPSVGQTVQFTDNSTNTPTNWSWTFSPTSVSYVGGTNSSSQNPQVQFNNSGYYSVTLIATNSSGSDPETKTNYILAGTSGNWTGATSTNWNTATNWEVLAVPTSSDNVTIPATAINWPTRSGNLTLGTDCGNITMNGASQLTVTGDLNIGSGTQLNCNNNAFIYVGGDWINNGTFNPGTGTVEFYGSNNATISGSSKGAKAITDYTLSTFTVGMTELTGASTGPAGDDGNGNYNLGFTFNYDGNDYTQVHICTNGWLSFNLSGAGAYTNSYLFNSTEPNTTLAPWFDDLNATGGSVVYKTEGTAPNRVFTAEWNSVLTYYSTATARLNFQVKLYETTNVIEFHYGNVESGTHSGSESASIGIEDATGGSGHFIEATTGSTTTGVTNLVSPGNWPAVNYRFSPVQPYLSFNNLSINKYNAEVQNSIDLDLTGGFNIKPDAWFTNGSGQSINILGEFLMEADPTGMASYIDNGTTTVAGKTYVQQYIEFNPQSPNTGHWHLVSAPISDATINTYFDMYLYEYDEPTNAYNSLSLPTTMPMDVGKGYYVTGSSQYIGSTTVTFETTPPSGTLNSMDVSHTSFTFSGPDPAYRGFQLVGNPFPCALQWNSSWSMSGLSGWMVYLEDDNYKGYHTDGTPWQSGTNIIPSTQGFWVRASSSGASLTIPASQRIHSNQDFYKETKEYIHPIVRLEAIHNDKSDEAVVVFHPEGNIGFDDYYDLTKFTNPEGTPQLYTVSENLKYAFNVLSEDYIETIIPLYFEISLPGIYRIEATEINNLADEVNVYLEDLKEGTVTELKSNPEYEFSYDPLDDPHRFNLHFKDSWYGLEDMTYAGIRIYSYADKIYVQTPEQEQGEIVVYDLMGHEKLRIEAEPSGQTIVTMAEPSGYYLVKVHSGSKVKTEKVFLK